MKPVMIVAGALVLVALLAGGCAIQGRNKVIALDESTKNQWGKVETVLQRRFELIPNLVESVKGETAQEQKVFLGIAEARTKYGQAKTVSEKAEAATEVESALARLLVIQEQYPQLRSNEAFLKLQDALEGSENRIATERRSYNDEVKTLNTYVRSFPGSLWAGFAGVEAKPYFEAPSEAKTAPKVDFSDKPKG